jgi:Ribbon-helix-helix domain
MPARQVRARQNGIPQVFPIIEKRPVAPSTLKKRPAATRVGLVSATVYLLPDKLELIKQICARTNHRISDLISEAIDDYLREHR